MKHSDTEPTAAAVQQPVRTPEGPAPLRAAGGLRALDIRIVDDEMEFLLLRRDWDDLVEAADVRICQTFDWAWSWWKYFGSGNRLHILTFRDRDRLVAIFPFFSERYGHTKRLEYRRIRLIGSGVLSTERRGLGGEYGPSDYLDVIVEPRAVESVAARFVSWLQTDGAAFDEFQLQNVPEEGALFRHIIPLTRTAGWRIAVAPSDACPYLPVPRSLDDYLGALHPGVRHRVRQSLKTFDGNSSFSIETISAPAAMESAYRDLVHLHQTRWTRLGYTGLFADRRFQGFAREVINAFRDKGWLWFKAVRLGGIRTAMRLGFMFKGRCYDYLSGFDDSLPGARKRPGIALLAIMIGDAHRSGIRVVDFLRGDEMYKFEFAGACAQNCTILLLNERSRRSARAIAYLFRRTVSAFVHGLFGEWRLLEVHLVVHGAAGFRRYGSALVSRISAKLGGRRGRIIVPRRTDPAPEQPGETHHDAQ